MGGNWWQVCVDEAKYQCWGDNRLDTETQASPKSTVVWDFSSSTHFPGAPVWRSQRPKLLTGSCFHHRCEGRPMGKAAEIYHQGWFERVYHEVFVGVWRTARTERENAMLASTERQLPPVLTCSWEDTSGPGEHFQSPLAGSHTHSLFPCQGRVRWLLSLCCDEAQLGLALPAGSLLDLPMLREAHFLLVSSSRKPAEQTGASSHT